ncbi:MAG: hypothetical protein L3J16_00515 [Anaerolineales bacterium]|nr:hypothetical protein [Anaerolineales bacterium]
MFYQNGVAHRLDGKPAVQIFDMDSGALTWRAWREHGTYAREGNLPHVERIDPETSVIVRAEYRKLANNKRGYVLHNDSGPAVIKYDRLTGKQVGAEFYRSGRKWSPPASLGFPSP